VGENVFGLVNWSDGLVFDEVQTDLEAAGYEVQAYVLPACAANAPHRSDRVWIVAYRTNEKQRKQTINWIRAEFRYAFNANGKEWFTTYAANVGQKQPRNTRKRRSGLEDSHSDECRNDANTNDKGLQGSEKHGSAGGGGPERNKQPERLFCTDWHNFPTQSQVCSRNNGIPAGLDGITFSKWRNESIKAAGNAIVPQIAYRIFDTINQFHNKTK
jgi:DNA (cytosine-5)-methyltransferase 1